jgi:hypothetical protein
MAEMESRIVQATLHERPANATHWSTRTLAEHLGVGATTVRTAWRNNGLKPHLSRTFKVSRDPRFEDKLLDVVGLYLNPPEHALVLSCDEKSQIQGASSEGWRVQQETDLPGKESEPRSSGSRKERKRMT